MPPDDLPRPSRPKAGLGLVMIMMVMMIPKESKDLVSWKVGEEGFIFRERGPQQFHWLN